MLFGFFFWKPRHLSLCPALPLPQQLKGLNTLNSVVSGLQQEGWPCSTRVAEPQQPLQMMPVSICETPVWVLGPASGFAVHRTATGAGPAQRNKRGLGLERRVNEEGWGVHSAQARGGEGGSIPVYNCLSKRRQRQTLLGCTQQTGKGTHPRAPARKIHIRQMEKDFPPKSVWSNSGMGTQRG